MEYLSVREVSEKWGVSKRRVLTLCNEGRIEGAKLVDSSWIIPEDAKRPKDGRVSKIYPISESVKAEGHTPQYKMHKYFARRPYNVFNRLVEHYTSEGDKVLDCFCGGGVTIYEAASLSRCPIGVDINPLATFITRMQIFNGDIEEFSENVEDFIRRIELLYGDYYKVKFSDDEGELVWAEYAYTVACKECGKDIVLIESNKKSNGSYYCPNEDCAGHKNGVKRVDCNPSGNKLVRIKYRSSIDGETKVRKASEEAFVISEKQCELLISNAKYKPNFNIPMDWDRQYEDKLAEKGILKYSDFFTIRNYAVNCGIFSDIMEQKNCGNSKYNEYLYFIFSSSLRYSNKMSRVTENWENGNPTSMDKHAFWLPNQYVEVNVVDIIRQRSKTILKGCAYSKSKLSKAVKEVDSFSDLKHGGEYLVLNRSSDSLPIPDEAIDMIITDPPYGSNVQYAELSTIWNIWYQAYAGLDSYIYKEREAVANRKKNFNGAKSIDDYEELLFRVYSEGNRVLKKDGYLVFTFNNKNIKVWIAMLKAVARAGFYLPEDGVLFQDYVDSYKNTAHLRFSGNIQGDFIYSFKKGEYRNEKKNNDNSIVEIIDNTIDVLIEKLYSEKKSYSTAELYRYIFASMTNRIMQYIKDKIVDGDEIEDISMFSNDYFDKELKKRLDYEGDVWLKKI